ncbi:hypothetical protein B0I37DRAFT_165120 [Chaetomium sp. MPI-CAGE-AT-0009]|nr:hypothetical protein B0I37DRAFT_165120 [Chaetomium sp. MPI-CAGE-AT-0009]
MFFRNHGGWGRDAVPSPHSAPILSPQSVFPSAAPSPVPSDFTRSSPSLRFPKTQNRMASLTNSVNRGGVTIGDGAVIGACSLVKRDVPPMSVAFGIPARVAYFLKDIKPTPPNSSVAAHTLADALALGNRLPLKGYLDPGPQESPRDGEYQGDGGGGACDDGSAVEGDEGLDFDLLGMDTDVDLDAPLPPGRPFSVGSGSTAHSVLRDVGLRGRLGRGTARDREGRALLLPRRRHQQRRRRRRWDVEAAAVTAVVIALLMVFFFAGVFLGASKISFGAEVGYL